MPQQLEPKAADLERDNVFSLLVYALVFRDWQAASVPREKRRGYNIGALLVNRQNEPVSYGLNCISSTENATQHGEVRAITSYLDRTRCFNLEGFTIYTSLEPCIMCAGMITMTSVSRVVYGQHDVEYSKAFERLSLDTRAIGGFPPYPRMVVAHATKSKYCAELDEAYRHFYATEAEKMLARFLSTDVAFRIYQTAVAEFLSYKVQHEENKKPYEDSLNFYNLLSS